MNDLSSLLAFRAHASRTAQVALRFIVLVKKLANTARAHSRKPFAVAFQLLDTRDCVAASRRSDACNGNDSALQVID